MTVFRSFLFLLYTKVLHFSIACEKLGGVRVAFEKLRGVNIAFENSNAYEKLGGVSVACDCHQSRPSHMSHHNGDTQA